MSSYRRTKKLPVAETKEIEVGVHYLRVSSIRQTHTAVDIDPDGNSIATQRRACDAKAASMGVTVAEEFVEPGKSAQTVDKRPQFRDMLAYIAKHPEVRYIFVYSRSRAFRNVEDAVLTRRQLRGLGVKIISTKEDFGTSLEAEFMETISDSMNDLQNRKNADNIRQSMAHKARSGGTIGHAPIGYRNVRVEIDGKQVNTVHLDPDRAPLVRALFELYASGEYTAMDLRETAEDLGLRARSIGQWKAERPLSLNSIYRVLADPYYAGYTVYENELFTGRHQPIVSQQLFDRVQDVLEAHSNRGIHHQQHHHYLKGLLFCARCHEAGRTRRLIYTEAKGRNGTIYPYYVCRGRQLDGCDLPHLRAETIERKIEDHYSTLSLTQAHADELQDAFEEAITNELQLMRDLATELNKELAKLDEQENRLLDALSEGDFPREKIRERLNTITRRRATVSERLVSTRSELDSGLATLTSLIQSMTNLQDLYRWATDDARQRINQALLDAVYVNDAATLTDEKGTPALELLRDAQKAFRSTNDPVAEILARPTVHAPEDDETPGQKMAGGSKTHLLVELPGIEPGSSGAESGLLRVQCVRSLFSASVLGRTRHRQAQSRKSPDRVT